MENELKRLLAIEEEAERLVDDAEATRRERIESAREEARQLEEAFERESRHIRDQHMQKAEARAQQVIEELHRRYEEQDAGLRAQAEANQEQALAMALRRFMHPRER